MRWVNSEPDSQISSHQISVGSASWVRPTCDQYWSKKMKTPANVLKPIVFWCPVSPVAPRQSPPWRLPALGLRLLQLRPIVEVISLQHSAFLACCFFARNIRFLYHTMYRATSPNVLRRPEMHLDQRTEHSLLTVNRISSTIAYRLEVRYVWVISSQCSIWVSKNLSLIFSH